MEMWPVIIFRYVGSEYAMVAVLKFDAEERKIKQLPYYLTANVISGNTFSLCGLELSLKISCDLILSTILRYIVLTIVVIMHTKLHLKWTIRAEVNGKRLEEINSNAGGYLFEFNILQVTLTIKWSRVKHLSWKQLNSM